MSIDDTDQSKEKIMCFFLANFCVALTLDPMRKCLNLRVQQIIEYYHQSSEQFQSTELDRIEDPVYKKFLERAYSKPLKDKCTYQEALNILQQSEGKSPTSKLGKGKSVLILKEPSSQSIINSQPEEDLKTSQSFSQDQNIRNYQEDRTFYAKIKVLDQVLKVYAVMDGHGGEMVADKIYTILEIIIISIYAQFQNDMKSFFQKLMEKLNDEIRKNHQSWTCGSCICIAIVRAEGHQRLVCHIANLGDTRGVLFEGTKLKRLTVDHKATSQEEQKEVLNRGGQIISNRLAGVLAVTRALGDFELEAEGLSIEPSYCSFTVRREQPTYLLIASDGLFDVCEDEEALNQTYNLSSTKEKAEKLVQYALQKGSKDNISVLIVSFKQE